MRYADIDHAIHSGTARDSLPGFARRVLDDIARGRRPIAAVRHPLGFLCLPLERRDGFGVCLHLWPARPPPAPATTSTVHCHSWDLTSFVLSGTVRNVRARLVDEPASRARWGTAHRVFEVVSHGDVDELRATTRVVRYSPGADTAHGAGETYTLPAGAFHSTFVVGGHDAATVALGRQDPEGGDLSLGPLDLETHRVRRRTCDPGETARTALDFSRSIAAAHAP